MSSTVSKTLNVVIIVFMLTVPTYLLIRFHANRANHTTTTSVEVHDTAPNGQSFPWEPIFTFALGLISLGLKYYKFDRKKPTESTVKKLLSHPLFNLMDELLMNDLRFVKFSSEGRNEVFKYMIRAQINSYKNILIQNIPQIESVKTNIAFRDWARKVLFSVRDDYSQHWEDAGIPKAVIESYSKWHEDRFNLLLSDIDTISFYKEDADIEENAFSFFTAISFILKLGVTTDSAKALSVLNGEISGLNFRGHTL